MDEFSLEGTNTGDLPFKYEPDSNEKQAGTETEVEMQVMDDISDSGSGGASVEALIKRLLARVQVLESQVASCLENQPLLYQVIGKCNVLEERLKSVGNDVNGRLDELKRGTIRTEEGPRSRQATFVPSKPIKNATTYAKNHEPDIEFDQFDSGSDKEWEPDQEDEDSNQDILDESLPEGGRSSTRSRNTISKAPADTPADAIVPSKPFSCKYCPASPPLAFYAAKSLANHYTSTHPLPDTDSPGSSTTLRSLKTTPVVSLTNTCPKCQKVFATPSDLEDHLKCAHNSYECEVCYTKFGLKKELAEHKQQAHGQNLKRGRRPTSFPCPDVCGRNFKDRRTAKDHLSACRGLKPHVCHRCGKAYGYVNNLRHHLAIIHADGKSVGLHLPVLCTECGRKISRKWFPKHMKTHAPPAERPRIFCDQCGMGFLDPKGFRNHRRNHTDSDRPRIPCQLCDKTFKDSDNLRKHMRLHTAPERHVCDECGRGFPTPRHLRKHKENHAKGIARSTPRKRKLRSSSVNPAV